MGIARVATRALTARQFVGGNNIPPWCQEVGVGTAATDKMSETDRGSP
jgi:hypothetical protein